MLPPILRTRFWRPVALPICSLRKVPIASVVKGTKMQRTAETGNKIGHDDVRHAHLQAQPAQQKAGEPQQGEAKSHQHLRIDPAHQRADHKDNATKAPTPRGVTERPASKAV